MSSSSHGTSRCGLPCGTGWSSGLFIVTAAEYPMAQVHCDLFLYFLLGVGVTFNF